MRTGGAPGWATRARDCGKRAGVPRWSGSGSCEDGLSGEVAMRNPADFEVLTTLEARVAPPHTALLVVDMQNDYCAPGGASDRNGRPLAMIQGIVPALRRLVEAARAAGVMVIWA